MYILDTNVISSVRVPDRALKVAHWLKGKIESELFLSVVTLGEIERAIRQQEKRNPEFAADLRRWLDQTALLFSDRILPFETTDARIWGRLTAELGHAGADLMIAATALAQGAIVVTGNAAAFEPTNVQVENPF